MTIVLGLLIAALDGGAPTWPPRLVDDLVKVTVTRGGQTAVVVRERDGWRMQAPRRGEADPDALTRLRVALAQPQIVATSPATGQVVTTIVLSHQRGPDSRVSIFEAPLGAPVPVRIEGVGDFLISAVEFPTKVPGPSDFMPPGLWIGASGKATSLEVKGRARYRLVGKGASWTWPDGGTSARDLDDVPGIITGRQAIGFPDGTPAQLGLSPPTSTARLCVGATCREFLFGVVAPDGGPAHFYAAGPGADPVELRDNDWKLLVDGP